MQHIVAEMDKIISWVLPATTDGYVYGSGYFGK
jgi:hypothetical protein